jgi:hypothetical protein
VASIGPHHEHGWGPLTKFLKGPGPFLSVDFFVTPFLIKSLNGVGVDLIVSDHQR